MRKLKRWCASLLLIWLSIATIGSVAYGQEAPPAADGATLDVALITFGPGTEVWERFGHNAIQVRDRTTGQTRLYNYGIFDFDQENFFLNFARGRMMYRMAVGDSAEEFPVYREEGRWIVEQDLNLEPAQRAKLAAYLDWNVRPENSEYRYDYFTANCSTRVRDALDMAVDGAIKQQTISPSRGFTYRMDALRLMRPETSLTIGMDAGLGPFADRYLSYWDESFVPMELMRHMREIHRVDVTTGASVPLVAREIRLADARIPDPLDAPPDWFWRALIVGIAIGLALIALARASSRAWARVVFGLFACTSVFVLSVGGLVLLALWFLTDHVSAWRNENILLFDPLCLLLLPAWLGSFRARWMSSKFARAVGLAIALLAGLALFIKIFPAFPQDNRFWLALLLPIHIGFAVALFTRRVSLTRYLSP
jgi:Domain of unknown function (DUF4105)